MKYSTTIGEKTYSIEINRDGEVTIDGQPYPIDLRAIDEFTYSLLLDNTSYEALVDMDSDEEVNVLLRGRLYAAQVMDERATRLAKASGGVAASTGEITMKSPMPGLIVAIQINEGDAVKKGQTLIVLESMKMENELKAPRDGTIGSIKVKVRQSVDQHQALLVVV
jgi:biotin carboxyl carrier protein